MQVNKIPAENSSTRMLWNITPGFWLQAINRVCGLTGIGTRISVGETRGSRWLRGPDNGYVLPLIYWLRFSPGGE